MFDHTRDARLAERSSLELRDAARGAALLLARQRAIDAVAERPTYAEGVVDDGLRACRHHDNEPERYAPHGGYCRMRPRPVASFRKRPRMSGSVDARASQLAAQPGGRQDRQRSERAALLIIEAVEIADGALIQIDILHVEEIRHLHRPPGPLAIEAQIELVVQRGALGVDRAVDRRVEVAVAIEHGADDGRLGQAGVQPEPPAELEPAEPVARG